MNAGTGARKPVKGFLRGLMLDGTAWLEVADRVSADDFHRPSPRLIFGVLADLAEADEPVDVVTLTDED